MQGLTDPDGGPKPLSASGRISHEEGVTPVSQSLLDGKLTGQLRSALYNALDAGGIATISGLTEISGLTAPPLGCRRATKEIQPGAGDLGPLGIAVDVKVTGPGGLRLPSQGEEVASQSAVEASFGKCRIRGMRAIRKIQGTDQKLSLPFFRTEDMAGRKITEVPRGVGFLELLKRLGLSAGQPGLERPPRLKAAGRGLGFGPA